MSEKTRSFFLWIPVVMFFFTFGPFVASGQANRSLTLTEALMAAAEQNPIVAAARHQLEAGESQIVQARSGYFPQVFLTGTGNRTTNPMWAFGTKLNQETITQADFDPSRLNDPDAINNIATALSANWSVYDGGRTGIGLKQAENKREVTSLTLKQTRQQIIANAATAYVGLLLAQKNISVVEQAIETAEANLKMVRSKFESGLAVKSDLLRAQVRMSELAQQKLQAESHVKIAQALLNAAIGSPEDQPIDPTTPLEECFEIKGSMEMWIETALSNRPDRSQLKLQEIMARQEIEKSRAGHLPTLGLFGTYEINTENFNETADNYNVGAVVSLNLFSGHRITAKSREAEAACQQVRAMQKNVDLQIRVETTSAFLKAVSAWEQIQVAKTAVTHAEESLRIVKVRYENGLLTIVSLLDAENALHQAQIRHYQAMHDYKVSRIMLAKSAGTIDVDFQ